MINSKEMERVARLLCRYLYYHFAQYLPVSYHPLWGNFSKKIRYVLCKKIFAYCGENVNIERKANFGSGSGLRIGNNSGLGMNCVVPPNSVIGNNVMMGPNCYVHSRNHAFSRTDIPMCQQGYTESAPLIIDDDVWIGRDVSILVGRHISEGSIIAANCVLTKDFPAYSIVGGNPSRVIRSRK